VTYFRRISFWVAFACGWLLIASVLSVFATIALSLSFSGYQGVAMGVAIHAVSAAAGFAYARSQARQVDTRGFPVMTKSEASGLHAAANDPAALHGLIEAGADVERRDNWDCTPLFYAVLEGNLESLEALIRAGADVNAIAGEPGCTMLASTPMNLALQCRNLVDWAKYDPIVKCLEEAGASLGRAI